jgi:hypothetical protein
MSALSEFKKTKEFAEYTDSKKEVFNRLVKEMAQKKNPRVVDFNILTNEDVAKIRGKIKEIN